MVDPVSGLPPVSSIVMLMSCAEAGEKMHAREKERASLKRRM